MIGQNKAKTNSTSNSILGFLAKVAIASLLLSLAIKYGGPLLPVEAPYTERLNGLVTAVIILPSLAVGIGLIYLLKAQRDSR